MTSIIKLKEYETVQVAAASLPQPLIQLLHDSYSHQVQVTRPVLRDDAWKLTAQGWVGTIPLTPDLSLRLEPKVPLHNLFGMWEYAYRLKMRQLEGLTECDSLAAFYDQLATVLARLVLDRGRQGFSRSYISRTELLPVVRGQLNINRVLRKPWDHRLECEFEEHTIDNEENQILAWTLHQVARRAHKAQTKQLVTQAFRTLQGSVRLRPISPLACSGRLYHRLNQDYQLLHALCRFFLEHSSPSHHVGDHTMFPFLINMAQLFELFVAEWLKANLPDGWRLEAQEHVVVDPGSDLNLAIDLVLYDDSGQPCYVLDTKYKKPERASTPDFNQIVTYAKVKQAPEAVLIYPVALERPLDIHLPNLHVRSLTFSLDSDLEQAGQQFLQVLLA